MTLPPLICEWFVLSLNTQLEEQCTPPRVRSSDPRGRGCQPTAKGLSVWLAPPGPRWWPQPRGSFIAPIIIWREVFVFVIFPLVFFFLHSRAELISKNKWPQKLSEFQGECKDYGQFFPDIVFWLRRCFWSLLCTEILWYVLPKFNQTLTLTFAYTTKKWGGQRWVVFEWVKVLRAGGPPGRKTKTDHLIIITGVVKLVDHRSTKKSWNIAGVGCPRHRDAFKLDGQFRHGGVRCVFSDWNQQETEPSQT